MSESSGPSATNAGERLAECLTDARQALQESQYQRLERSLREARTLLKELSNPTAPPLPPVQKEGLQRAYEQLALIAGAHKQAVQNQLVRVREGKRTITAYAHHV